MRIAVVNSIRVFGGGEKWVVRQAGCWQQRGHEPLIVCQPASGLLQHAREAGLGTAAVSMPHDVSLQAMGAIAGVLRGFKPDVVMCCNERAFRLTAPAARRAENPPLIYRNGLTATFKNKAINRFLIRWLTRFVVISEPLRAEMASYGWIPSDRLQIIRNGIDLRPYRADTISRERVRREVGCAPDAVVAGILARVTPDKGQVETISALAQIAARHPKAELWIVGEGTLRPQLEAQARELGLESRVRFLGFRNDIPAILQAVDIVVQASHREGLGNTLLEAMAAARPIVASTAGGIVDVVIPEETGLLVAPYEVAPLAEALDRLYGNAELRTQFGAAGLRRAETVFPLTGETDRWCELFAELGGTRASRPRATPQLSGTGDSGR